MLHTFNPQSFLIPALRLCYARDNTKLSQGQMKPINSINFTVSQMPCTNIAPVPPATIISAGTDGGVGKFWQINIDGRKKKKCGNLLRLHISNQKAIEIVIVFVRRSFQK